MIPQQGRLFLAKVDNDASEANGVWSIAYIDERDQMKFLAPMSPDINPIYSKDKEYDPDSFVTITYLEFNEDIWKRSTSYDVDDPHYRDIFNKVLASLRKSKKHMYQESAKNDDLVLGTAWRVMSLPF